MLCWSLHPHPAEQDTVISLTQVVYSNGEEGEEEAICILVSNHGLEQVVLTFSPVFITVKTLVVSCLHVPNQQKSLFFEQITLPLPSLCPLLQVKGH